MGPTIMRAATSSFNVFWVRWLGLSVAPLKFKLSEVYPWKMVAKMENILSFWERYITFQGEGKRRESLNWNIYIHWVVTGSPQKIEDLRLASKCTFQKRITLKLTKTPPNIGRAPKGKWSEKTIHFQEEAVFVSGFGYPAVTPPVKRFTTSTPTSHTLTWHV